MTLVERDGRVRSFHLASVNAATLRPILTSPLDRKSYLMTDEGTHCTSIGREFGGHGTVNHSIEEYVRGGFWHTNRLGPCQRRATQHRGQAPHLSAD